ncbi:uncharacterized protein LOC110695554 [Chenopodium quinoa]|uniref:uncharacterized protein LOC110695554 n=1 Tax=Chenopodium quinoa TaxID=63459 RepID=UPI000B794FF5|nr:uncharacterized protein LOC110695554 [Chenopodium quinoa]
MSWLARSIANSLRIDDDDDTTLPPPSSSHSRREKPPASVISVEERENIEFDGDLRGVKDDLSEFKETLTRQLWGVANFLAPPPCTACSSSSHDHRVVPELDRSESISGVEDDDESLVYGLNSTEDGNYSDIGDRNLGNCESSSSLHRLGLQKVEEEDDDWVKEAVGLTDEVLTFAGNIAHHPETWLDFPVEEDEDFEDFPMSESQKRHAQAVEHLSPRLAALRIELCPAHMSVGFFWKVYFVLLHSRLNKQDADLLSTLEVVEARAKWMQEQQKRTKKDSEWNHAGLYSRLSADFDDNSTPRSTQNEHSETFSSWTFASEPATSSTVDSDVEKHTSNELQFIDKSIIDEKQLTDTDDKNILAGQMSERPVLSFIDDDDDSDEWPEDDCLGQSGSLVHVGIADEVSFSDLEDDDCCIPVVSKP